jgi:hypothetical protein
MITNDDIAKLKGWIRRDESEWHLGEIYDYSYFVDSLGQYASGDTLPDWTGDIAEAWKLVIEVMASDKHWSPMLSWDDGDGDAAAIGWDCTFYYYGEVEAAFKMITGFASAETAAICEAYAKWKGEK